MKLHKWIKENRFIRENRVLLVVFPLVALLMGGFGNFLLAMKTNENILCLSKPFHWYSKEKPEAVIKSEALISPREIIKKKRRRKISTYKTGVTRSRVMKKGLFSRMHSPRKMLPITTESMTNTKNMKKNIKWIFKVPAIEDSLAFYKRPVGAIATRMLRTPPERSYGFSFSQLHKRENYKTDEKRNTSLCCGRTSEAIRDSVMANVGKLKAMYDSALQENPNLAGKLKTRFTINGKGRITASTIINSTIHNKSFEKKIIKNIESWDFGNSPHPGEVIEVTYPFVFVENK